MGIGCLFVMGIPSQPRSSDVCPPLSNPTCCALVGCSTERRTSPRQRFFVAVNQVNRRRTPAGRARASCVTDAEGAHGDMPIPQVADAPRRCGERISTFLIPSPTGSQSVSSPIQLSNPSCETVNHMFWCIAGGGAATKNIHQARLPRERTLRKLLTAWAGLNASALL